MNSSLSKKTWIDMTNKNSNHSNFLQFPLALHHATACGTLDITRYVNSREATRNTKGSRWTG